MTFILKYPLTTVYRIAYKEGQDGRKESRQCCDDVMGANIGLEQGGRGGREENSSDSSYIFKPKGFAYGLDLGYDRAKEFKDDLKI